MVRRKTSVYVDEDLWAELKRHAVENGLEVSSLLEGVIREELMSYLGDALEELAGLEDYELDFEPVKPKEGLVSALVREMRYERSNSIP